MAVQVSALVTVAPDGGCAEQRAPPATTQSGTPAAFRSPSSTPPWVWQAPRKRARRCSATAGGAVGRHPPSTHHAPVSTCKRHELPAPPTSWSAEASEEPKTHRRPCHRPRRTLASPTNGCDGREYKQPGGRATTCRDVPPGPQCIAAPITRARHPVSQRRLHLQTVAATAARLALLFIAAAACWAPRTSPPNRSGRPLP